MGVGWNEVRVNTATSYNYIIFMIFIIFNFHTLKVQYYLGFEPQVQNQVQTGFRRFGNWTMARLRMMDLMMGFLSVNLLGG